MIKYIRYAEFLYLSLMMLSILVFMYESYWNHMVSDILRLHLRIFKQRAHQALFSMWYRTKTLSFI